MELPRPHPKQNELINAFELNQGVRFVVGACGTKFGKTYGCSIRIVKEAWENPGSLNWWVAPTYDQSMNAYNLVLKLLPKGFYNPRKADRVIEILAPDGSVHSEIVFKSGDNPDSLRGFGVHFFIIDEAARMPYESFVSVITTITQTYGRGIIISTPKGRGWFYEVYQRGEKLRQDGNPKFQDPSEDPWREWMAIRMPTWTNPHVKEQAILDAKKNLPSQVFDEEYAAIFNLESAGVFHNIYGCARGILEEPQPGHYYVIGVDLARLRDYSVLTVMDRQRKHVVAFQRFNRVEWEFQYQKIRELSQAYHGALCVVDSTGIGDPIVEALRNGGVPVEPYKIGGNIAKQQLIERLRVAIEKGRISYPVTLSPLLLELEKYEYKISDAGVIRYEAPEGFHDDCVISLALATWVADAEPFIYRFTKRRGV